MSFPFTFGVHSSVLGLPSGPLPTHKTPIHSGGGGLRLLSGFNGWVKLLRRSVPTIHQNCPFCRKYNLNLSDYHQESLRTTRIAFTPDMRMRTQEPLSKKAANGSFSMTEKVLNEHLGFRIRYANNLITIFKMQNNLQ